MERVRRARGRKVSGQYFSAECRIPKAAMFRQEIISFGGLRKVICL
jgi:hypothetical protein